MAPSQYRTYKIVSGKDGGAGSFLSPPGHYSFAYSLHEMSSNRHNAYVTGISGLDYLDNPESNASPAIMAQWKRIKAAANASVSELWLRSVYAHFRNCYRPENGSANASEVEVYKGDAVVCDDVRALLTAAGFTRGGKSMISHVDGFRTAITSNMRAVVVTHYVGGEDVAESPMLPLYAAALTGAGFDDVTVSDGRVRVPVTLPERPSAERHSAVCYVRGYFPNHAPRLDLIEKVKPPTGPCDKCGAKVQYEGRHNALCIVTTRMDGRGYTHWAYNPVCADGGPHTR